MKTIRVVTDIAAPEQTVWAELSAVAEFVESDVRAAFPKSEATVNISRSFNHRRASNSKLNAISKQWRMGFGTFSR